MWRWRVVLGVSVGVWLATVATARVPKYGPGTSWRSGALLGLMVVPAMWLVVGAAVWWGRRRDRG